ncbi:MAG: hypothetical protein CMH41_04020 [Micrococcales bacterium]|nr:hypothetical protein [Micrococcales bacterium]
MSHLKPLPVAGPLDPILQAAREVVMTHGPRRATVTEVAQLAGVSRMTVYRRYESLDRIIFELLTAELAQVLSQLTVDPEQGTARERTTKAVTTVIRETATHPVLAQILRIDPEALTPLMVSRFGHTQQAAVAALTPLIAAGMSTTGGDGSIPDGNPEVVAQSIIISVQSWVFASPAIDDLPNSESVWNQLPGLVAGMLTQCSEGHHV